MGCDERAGSGAGVPGDQVGWLHGRHRGGPFEDKYEGRGQNVGRLHACPARELREQPAEPGLVRVRELAGLRRLWRLHRRDDERAAVKPLRGQHLGVHLQHFEKLALRIVLCGRALLDGRRICSPRRWSVSSTSASLDPKRL